MNPKIEARFRELATKEALGTLTPEEFVKLERYSVLRRPPYNPPREVKIAAWRTRELARALRGRFRENPH